MKKDCEFSNLPAITRDTFVKMPLILHRRIGLQQMIAHWAQINLEHLNITATYNVVHGSPVSFVKNNMGYFLITRDLLSPELDSSVTFIPLAPSLEIKYNLAWKRHNVFSKASKLFLQKIKEIR